MANLVPDPNNPPQSQVANNTQNRSELYFQSTIEQLQNRLNSTTDLDEYKKILEVIQLAIESSERRNQALQKSDLARLQIIQEQIKVEMATIELGKQKMELTETKFITSFRLICIPVFAIAGIYVWYTSDSLIGSALLFFSLRLALSKEDISKGLDSIKNLFSK